MKYVPLFVLIQIVNVPLFLMGLPICLVLSILHAWHDQICAVKTSAVYGKTIQVWPALFWLWSNDEDGVLAGWYGDLHHEWPLWLRAFMWTGLRNSVNNLRFVPGVSAVGRPLWYWTNGKHYVKAGWLSDGFPVLSAGSGTD